MTGPTERRDPLQRFGSLAGLIGAIIGMVGFQLLTGGWKSDRERIDDELSKSRVGAIIKQEFPEDYAEVLSEFTRINEIRGASRLERGQAAATVMAKLRGKYSEFAGRAPDQSLRSVLGSQIELLSAIEDRVGAAACAKAANSGLIEFAGTRQLDNVSANVDEAAAAIFSAIAAGRKAPVSRAAVNGDDYSALFSIVMSMGATEQDIDTFADGVTQDADCDLSILTLRALLDMGGEAGERLRSYFVDTLTLPS